MCVFTHVRRWPHARKNGCMFWPEFDFDLGPFDDGSPVISVEFHLGPGVGLKCFPQVHLVSIRFVCQRRDKTMCIIRTSSSVCHFGIATPWTICTYNSKSIC